MAEQSVCKGSLPKSLRILSFGDSLTAGYTRYGLEHYPYADHLRTSLEHDLSSSDIQVEVAGMSGDQVQGSYLSRIKAKCTTKERRYDWVIVMGGTNDLAWGQPPETIFAGLSESFVCRTSHGERPISGKMVCRWAPNGKRNEDSDEKWNTSILQSGAFTIGYRVISWLKG